MLLNSNQKSTIINAFDAFHLASFAHLHAVRFFLRILTHW